jgi:hypothetical protein
MITIADFPALTDDLQSIFNEVAKRKVAENVGFSVFDVFDTNRRTFDHLILHGMSGIKKVTPGEDLPKIPVNEGDTITWTQAYYGGAASITKEMRMFDLYNQITTIIGSLAEDAFDKVDQSLADRLLGGFGNTYVDPFGETVSTLGPDGVRLFSASHTNALTSENMTNLCQGSTVNPVLSRDAIVDTMVEASIHRDPNNMIRPINLDTLLIAPANRDTAERLVMSQYLPGSANNDINPLYGRVKIVVWPRLSQNSAGSDTSAYWFMFDSRAVKESLKCLFAERPSLDAPEQVYINKNYTQKIPVLVKSSQMLETRKAMITNYVTILWITIKSAISRKDFLNGLAVL